MEYQVQLLQTLLRVNTLIRQRRHFTQGRCDALGRLYHASAVQGNFLPLGCHRQLYTCTLPSGGALCLSLITNITQFDESGDDDRRYFHAYLDDVRILKDGQVYLPLTGALDRELSSTVQETINYLEAIELQLASPA